MIRITPSLDATHHPAQFAYSGLNKNPICVSAGMGVDSTAMLIGLHHRGIRPDLITFADVGSEKPDTYLFVPILREWLRSVGFPDLVVVHLVCPRAGHTSLHDNMLTNETLPSIAFGRKACTLRWKVSPQDDWRIRWEPINSRVGSDRKVPLMIGFDATEGHRVKSGGTYGISSTEKKHKGLQSVYDIQYPLRDWGWDRDKCKSEIRKAGLPVPVKSACFCCPATKKAELPLLDIDQLRTAVRMEENYLAGRHFRPDSTTIGLGRRWAWRPYLSERMDDACQKPTTYETPTL